VVNDYQKVQYKANSLSLFCEIKLNQYLISAMKKFCLFFAILITTISVSHGQFTKLGGGFGFTTGYPFQNTSGDYNRSGHLYAYAKGIVELSLPFHLSPSLTLFFPNVTKINSGTYTISTLMLDINGHYVVNSLDRFEFYGLAGFDILLAWGKVKDKVSATVTETFKKQDNALGLNIGAGVNMKITEQIDLFAEAKYIIYGKDKLFFSNYNQFTASAGVLINLRWLAKNENPKM
jgi:opacity protein-like surface antigen